jgi:hypothetical protein
MEAHSPEEEDQRWEKHDVEDEMFVHFFNGSRIQACLPVGRGSRV